MLAAMMHDRADSRATKAVRQEVWSLCLYVAGKTLRSAAALSDLRKLCEEQVPGRYRIEVIDILENPAAAKRDQILAIPTVVRKRPQPLKKTVGNLSDARRVLVGLGFEEQVAEDPACCRA